MSKSIPTATATPKSSLLQSKLTDHHSQTNESNTPCTITTVIITTAQDIKQNENSQSMVKEDIQTLDQTIVSATTSLTDTADTQSSNPKHHSLASFTSPTQQTLNLSTFIKSPTYEPNLAEDLAETQPKTLSSPLISDTQNTSFSQKYYLTPPMDVIAEELNDSNSPATTPKVDEEMPVTDPLHKDEQSSSQQSMKNDEPKVGVIETTMKNENAKESKREEREQSDVKSSNKHKIVKKESLEEDKEEQQPGKVKKTQKCTTYSTSSLESDSFSSVSESGLSDYSFYGEGDFLTTAIQEERFRGGNYKIVGHKFINSQLNASGLVIFYRYSKEKTYYKRGYFDLYEKSDEEHKDKLCKYVNDQGIRGTVVAKKLGIPKKNTGGAAPETFDQLQLQVIDANFYSGWLYSNKKLQTLQFRKKAPSLKSKWHIPDTDRTYMDCVLHAINYAMGYAYFTEREQSVRLMAIQLHRNKDYYQFHKAFSGVTMNAFKNFAVDGKGQFYSINKLPIHSTQCLFTQLEALKDNDIFLMIYEDLHQDLTFKHTITIKKQNKCYACYDSLKSSIEYYSHIGKNLTGYQKEWRAQSFLDRINPEIELYALEKSQVEDMRKDEQMRNIERFLTSQNEITLMPKPPSKKYLKARGSHYYPSKRRKISSSDQIEEHTTKVQKSREMANDNQMNEFDFEDNDDREESNEGNESEGIDIEKE